MTHNDVDLLYWENGSARRMSSYTSEWLSTEVDAKGAIGPLAKEVMEKFPSLFATERDAQTFLTIRHFHNMSRHENCAGLPYPTVIGSER
jgi:hypothetical protein